jgi:2-succinyl-5-enolpyruvyl-6-hydroxy-3-cyclohexene-1-carboxylate synthase
MTTVTDTYTLLRAFVDELVRCGMRAACTSPGSRSSPLVLSLARDPRLRCYSHIDERCSGFFALGMAKAAGLPVAVACTSGTAAAGLAGAVIEAHEARVPLIVLTADRPAELRENGAGQAIDQVKMFTSAKWFFEVSVHEAGDEQLRWMRTLACRAFWTSVEGRPGAVHLNFPLREPLVGEFEPPEDRTGREDARPFLARSASAAAGGPAAQRLRELLAGSRRGIVVAGRHERDTPLGRAAGEFASRAGWPLLADPLSGARRGPAAVAHYDALLRDEEFASGAGPDLVLRVGDLPVSKPLRTWLAGLRAPQAALDPEGSWQDPSSALGDVLALEPARALLDLASAPPVAPPAQEDWAERWLSADRLASQAIFAEIAGERLSEPAVAAELGVLLPSEVTLFVASSMPVRDIETFWPVRDDPPRVLCNRGANGIDGTVSSAFGVAAAQRGPVVLLIGDVALAHDIGGLIAAGRLGLALTIVLIQNDGGGIFDFLPLSRTSLARGPAGADQDIYTRHVLTPTGLDFERACSLYGIGHQRPADMPALRAALESSIAGGGCDLIEVRCSREENVALHGRIWQAVSRELRR